VPATLSKLEFSRLLGVSPSRVTAYIAKGRIYGAALVGSGRFQRIIPDVAREQLRKTLHVTQHLANGAARLDRPETPLAGSPPVGASPRDDVVVQIQEERLRQMRLVSRRQEEDELRRCGQLVPAGQVDQALRRVAGRMLAVMDGAISAMAEHIAARLQVPRRDALYELRQEWRKAREAAETEFRREVATMPATVDLYRSRPLAGEAGAIAEAETPAWDIDQAHDDESAGQAGADPV
jgi:hypothetical protein